MARTSRTRITEARIAKIIGGAKRAGIHVKLEIDGEKMVLTEIPAPTSEPQNELDKWKAKRARPA